MDRTLSIPEFYAALKAAPKVYAAVQFVPSYWDGGDPTTYVQVPKAEIQKRFRQDVRHLAEGNAEGILAFTDEETGTLYVG
jgi:hypothetical protein